MYTLILDSSNKNLSVGLVKGNVVIDFVDYDAWQRQSELMVEEIKKLCEKNHILVSQITKVVTAVGPGSYTGVRISVTIAKVIAFALNIPLYEISSLSSLADSKKPSICLINARANRSFVGVYNKDKTLLKDTILSNEEVLKYISNHKDYVICGDVEYLNLTNHVTNRFERIINVINEEYKTKDILALKPVYLKD